MNEKLKIMTDLIEALEKEQKQTPFLQVAIGGLRTAAENLAEHSKGLKKLTAENAENAKNRALTTDQ